VSKVFRVTKKSWHYKLLSKRYNLSKGYYCYYPDFCSYWRAVVFTLLRMGFSVAFLAFVALVCVAIAGIFLVGNAAIVSSMLGIFPDFTQPFLEQQTVGNFILTLAFVLDLVLILLGMAYIVACIAVYLLNRPLKNKKEKQPSLFMMKYLSHRDKYCPRIEYDL